MKNVKPNTNLIAVFGSLRKGLLYHDAILSNEEYIGETTTDPIFTLFDYGNFPGLIHAGNTEVTIEVYKVNNNETWKNLDMLEGYPSFYNRMIIETVFGYVWIYYNSAEQLAERTVIASGDWKDYLNNKKQYD